MIHQPGKVRGWSVGAGIPAPKKDSAVIYYGDITGTLRT